MLSSLGGIWVVREFFKYQEYFECPTCRAKHFVQLNSIPKSLVIIQLIESTRHSLRNQSPLNQRHFSNSQFTDLPPPYSSQNNGPSQATYSKLSQSNQATSGSNYNISHESNVHGSSG